MGTSADFTDDQLLGFEIGTRISSVLTMVGTLVVMGYLIANRNEKLFKHPSNRLLFFLSFADFFVGAVRILRYRDSRRWQAIDCASICYCFIPEIFRFSN